MIKPLEIVSQHRGSEKVEMALRHLPFTPYSTSQRDREITEKWLLERMNDLDINFGYFFSLSFYKQTDNPIIQYLDNHHIRKVILDYFYPHAKPKNRIRLWFFVEQHKSGKLHLHSLMEKVDWFSWFARGNRKLILHKKTLNNIIENKFDIEDVGTQALTNHLKEWINKLGRGKKSTKIKSIGEVEQRVHYLNKSLDSLSLPNIENFNKWEHIDFQNSDLEDKSISIKGKSNERNKSI